MDLGTLMIYHTGEKTMNREQIEEQRESIKKAELVVEGLDVIINSLTNVKSAIKTEIVLSNNILDISITEKDSIDKVIKLTNAVSELYVNHTDLNDKVALAYAINNKVGEILCDIAK